MSNLASKVPMCITFNQPHIGIVSGPAINTVLKSHARVYHFYKEQLNGTGDVSMKSVTGPSSPLDPSNSTIMEATQHLDDLYIDTFFDPLVALGSDYLQALKDTIQDYVPLSDADKKYLKVTIDVISVDYYTVSIVTPVVADIQACAHGNSTSNHCYPTCVHQRAQNLTGCHIGSSSPGIAAPVLTRQGLNTLYARYKLPIIITEIGTTDYEQPTAGDSGITGEFTGSNNLAVALFDTLRSDYIISCLKEILKAIWEDGVPVKGVLTWSFADNWEWGTFGKKLGLQAVNLTTKERFYKRIMFDLVDLYRAHGGRP